MISGIGGSYMDAGQMAAMRGQMRNPFENLDSNEDGSLDKTELGSFAEKISEMTGQSVNVDELVSKLDADEDGLVSHDEFESGRPQGPPQGPPPGMAGMMNGMQMGGMQGGGIENFLSMLNSSEDENSSSLVDSLDTNGDGTVDSEEAKSGISYLIQEYKNQATGTLIQGGESGSQLNLVG